MANAGNLPKHLEVAARTAILGAKARDDMPYRSVALEVDLTAASTTFVDLGGTPQPTRNARAVDDIIEKGKTVEPEDWYLTVPLSQNAIDDDQTGSLRQKFAGLLPSFQRHINSTVFTYLNAGDATTYGTGLDSATAAFFSDSHIYAGGKNTTGQDNLNNLALSLDNFNTAWVAARQFKDDAENFYNLPFTHLVCGIALNSVAANIMGNQSAYDTSNREVNPYAGGTYLAVPEFDSTAWVLVAGPGSDIPKPMFVAIRKRPELIDIKWDSQAGDGGKFFFVYHGRYVVGYGDPLLAYMGNT